MIRLDWWFAAVAPMSFLWQQCGENFAVFCYRIGVSIFARSSWFLLPGAEQRVPVACSIPSAAYSTRSTTLKD
jgi:hypothetical protein